jgi:hypothetical protein
LWIFALSFTLLGGGVSVFIFADYQGAIFYRGKFFNGQPLGSFFILILGFVMAWVGIATLKRLLRSNRRDPGKDEQAS